MQSLMSFVLARSPGDGKTLALNIRFAGYEWSGNLPIKVCSVLLLLMLLLLLFFLFLLHHHLLLLLLLMLLPQLFLTFIQLFNRALRACLQFPQDDYTILVRAHPVRAGEHREDHQIIRVTMLSRDTTTYIGFHDQKHDAVAPMRISNECTKQNISFRQQTSTHWEVLAPGKVIVYAWDEPGQPHQIECYVHGKSRAILLLLLLLLLVLDLMVLVPFDPTLWSCRE